MSKFTSENKERLTELLEKELKLLKQIRKLTEEQEKLLAEDDMEAFNSSLEKRADIIEQINGLHQETSPLMQSYVSLKRTDSEIDEFRAQIKEELNFCAKLNSRYIAQINNRSGELSKKIDEKRAKREGIGGYAQASPTTSEIFDKKR